MLELPAAVEVLVHHGGGRTPGRQYGAPGGGGEATARGGRGQAADRQDARPRDLRPPADLQKKLLQDLVILKCGLKCLNFVPKQPRKVLIFCKMLHFVQKGEHLNYLLAALAWGAG